jgi:hypothetical protein
MGELDEKVKAEHDQLKVAMLALFRDLDTKANTKVCCMCEGWQLDTTLLSCPS